MFGRLMREITQLERQQKDTTRINVYLDGTFAFGLNEVDAAALRTGQTLSEADIAALRHKDDIVKAVNRGVDLLSYRPRSTQEIRERLAQRDTPDAVIELAIERLQDLGYLDDVAFARFWIEGRDRHKPRGHRALRYELRDKGIAQSIIDDLLDELVDEDDAAYRAAEGRVRRLRGHTQHEFKQKIGAFLQRRGFSYGAAQAALDRWMEMLQAEDATYFAQAHGDDD